MPGHISSQPDYHPVPKGEWPSELLRPNAICREMGPRAGPQKVLECGQGPA